MTHSRFPRVLLAVCLVLLLLPGLALASPTLRNGSQGRDVLLLQQKLKKIGYPITSTDGVFGNETERAVAMFQQDQKIHATGIVNNATWRALKKAKERKGGSLAQPSAPGNLLPAPMGKSFLKQKEVAPLLATARKYIGTPYRFGGTTPKGFDCSGYLQFVFSQHGIKIPRLADDQYRLGARASAKQLVPGDLVFFNTDASGISHCGIYLGDGKFIHASSSKGIRIDELSSDYWKPRYAGGKHIVS